MIDKLRLDAASLARVRREVALLKRLRHAHIVRLYQVIETDRLLYIVTELAANGEVFGALLCPALYLSIYRYDTIRYDALSYALINIALAMGSLEWRGPGERPVDL